MVSSINSGPLPLLISNSKEVGQVVFPFSYVSLNKCSGGTTTRWKSLCHGLRGAQLKVRRPQIVTLFQAMWLWTRRLNLLRLIFLNWEMGQITLHGNYKDLDEVRVIKAPGNWLILVSFTRSRSILVSFWLDNWVCSTKGFLADVSMWTAGELWAE
jgi:hypothetical protein